MSKKEKTSTENIANEKVLINKDKTSKDKTSKDKNLINKQDANLEQPKVDTKTDNCVRCPNSDYDFESAEYQQFAGYENDKSQKSDVDQTTTTPTREKVRHGEMANLKALAEARSQKQNKAQPRLSQSTSDILKCIIVLTLIAVVAGALLGLINFVTYVDADAAILSEIATHYEIASDRVRKDNARAIAPDGAKSYIKDCFIVLKQVEANDDQSPSFSNPADIDAVVYRAVGSGAYSGTLELLVFVSGDTITDISVYANEETQGIGSKVLSQNYLSQYVGVNLSLVESFVKAENAIAPSDIVFISGATKTSKGINNALNAVLYAHNNFGGAGQ